METDSEATCLHAPHKKSPEQEPVYPLCSQQHLTGDCEFYPVTEYFHLCFPLFAQVFLTLAYEI